MTLKKALTFWIVFCVFFLMGMLWSLSRAEAKIGPRSPGAIHALGQKQKRFKTDRRCRDPKTNQWHKGCR